MKLKIGYCAVTADILHSGHIKFINACKERCGYLIVGVMTDECVKRYKKANPILPLNERMFVVSNLKAVDDVIAQDTFDYPIEILKIADIVFDSHNRKNSTVNLERTKGISSSIIKNKIIEQGRE